MKKRQLTILAFASVFLFAGQTLALFSLPDSSYQNGAWMGTSSYTQNNLSVVVDFAVYDKLGGNEWTTVAGWDAPGEGRFIYAYQIKNFTQGKQLAAFNVFDDDGTFSETAINSIDSYDDGTDGKEPTGGSFDSSKSAVVWQFGGSSALVYQDHSWVLLFTSNYSPTKGTYSFETAQNDIPIEGDTEVPEPATMVLLSTCAVMHIFTRKRRKA